MKKLLLILLVGLAYSSPCYAQKITALTLEANPTSDDLLYLVDAPSGTAASRKTTVGDLVANSTIELELIDENSLLLNTQNIESNSIFTHSSTQYAAIWNESNYLELYKRDLTNDGGWEHYAYDGTGGRASILLSGNDNHDGIGLGVSDDGIVHLVYDQHSDALNYAYTPSAGDISALTISSTMLGTNETSVTYPVFFNGNSGELYFMFRDGLSGDGDSYLYEHTSGSGWQAATGTGTAGLFIDGRTTISSNPYVVYPGRDANNDLVFAWVWRGTTDANTTNDVMFVKYDETVFTQADGTAQTVPILSSNSEKILDTADTGSGLQALQSRHSACGDSDGNYYVVYEKYDANSRSQVYVSKYSSGAWVEHKITNFDSPVSSLDFLGSVIACYNNNVYVMYYDAKGTGAIMAQKLSSDFTANKTFPILQYSTSQHETRRLGNLDLNSLYSTGNLYIGMSLMVNNTTTGVYRPYYMLHWDLSKRLLPTALQSDGFVKYGDTWLYSVNGDVTVKAGNSIKLDSGANEIFLTDEKLSIGANVDLNQQFEISGASTQAKMVLYTGAVDVYIGSIKNETISGSSPGRNIRFLTGTALAETFVMTASGYLGIGVTSPTVPLSIDKGTGWGQITSDGSSGACLMMRDTDDAGWTECSFLDGTMSCTTDADGVCDGI